MQIVIADKLPVSRVFTALILAVFLVGCDSIGYYSQAASGQIELMRARQPIDALINDPNTAPELRERLALVLELREFAASSLALPVDGQYASYADLQREAVVWNVFAAPELSLQSKTWCYPIAGCAAYRGYFRREAAQDYASTLEAEGYETYVGGVAAYSTLGWVDDPVLNTFINRTEAQLADLIFHELAHKQLYIPGDTQFNESFATTVAIEGVKRWMLQRDDVDAFQQYLQEKARQDEFINLIVSYREQLDELYRSGIPDGEKRQAKMETVFRLREAFVAMQEGWGNQEAYSAWMAGTVNNAKLNSVALYFDLVPALQSLLGASDYDLAAFYARCEALDGLSPEQRREQLQAFRLDLGGA